MVNIINRPLYLMKETFIPLSYDENHFEMKWTMEAGGVVPPHFHRHAEEHFTVLEGEVVFKINGQETTKTAGDTLFLQRMTPHGISNKSGKPISLLVRYTPCADNHKMFTAWAVFADEGNGTFAGMLKWWFVQEKLGWKKFSEPADAVGRTIFSIIGGIAMLSGALLGWKKYLEQFD